MSTRELNSHALEESETTGTCSDGKKCGVPPKVGDDAYCLDCPNKPSASNAPLMPKGARLTRDFVRRERSSASNDSLEKQARYQDAKGEDWIDEFARTATPEEFRGAMRFTIGKYNRRAGKKDALISEIRKMKDYCQRWEDYELSQGDEQ
ncbi:DUF3310 domain-containing protein [Vreelandella populi]|uniref:DUF3310 domain-containing protein n=1 Tax=Vreelandella populi TaxID=2498858 RepID=UPI000F8DC89F|nr:DUF3310 domain-containing protein [Halomonas populi]RUR52720.1 DUF3310 domain-containing protein [Halomonas populi]